MSRICDITAHDLARTHVSYYNDDAKRTKGMHKQRTQKAWGHAAQRGWARLRCLGARSHCYCCLDTTPHGIGYLIGKAQTRAFGEIKGLRAKGLERRADWTGLLRQ